MAAARQSRDVSDPLPKQRRSRRRRLARRRQLSGRGRRMADQRCIARPRVADAVSVFRCRRDRCAYTHPRRFAPRRCEAVGAGGRARPRVHGAGTSAGRHCRTARGVGDRGTQARSICAIRSWCTRRSGTAARPARSRVLSRSRRCCRQCRSQLQRDDQDYSPVEAAIRLGLEERVSTCARPRRLPRAASSIRRRRVWRRRTA